MKKTATKTMVPVQHNESELETLDWLKKETKRTRSGAIRWSVEKAAKELGYVPPKRK